MACETGEPQEEIPPRGMDPARGTQRSPPPMFLLRPSPAGHGRHGVVLTAKQSRTPITASRRLRACGRCQRISRRRHVPRRGTLLDLLSQAEGVGGIARGSTCCGLDGSAEGPLSRPVGSRAAALIRRSDWFAHGSEGRTGASEADAGVSSGRSRPTTPRDRRARVVPARQVRPLVSGRYGGTHPSDLSRRGIRTHT